MTHRIESNTHYQSGESVRWEFTIEEGGSAKSISGAALEWYLLPFESSADANAVLDHTDSGVTLSLTTDGSDGRVDLVIEQGVTDDLEGTYWQRLVVDDAGDGLQQWGGSFPIR